MKKIFFIFSLILLNFTLFGFEIFNGDVYPGVVNHVNTSYGYGTFHLNTMESEFSTVTIERILTFNNSLTRYEYTYSNGILTGFKESFQIAGGDFSENGTYTYGYKEGKLSDVKLNGADIFFPSPYFLMIRSRGDEVLFDYEFNSAGELISILYSDPNGTKYFLKDKLLTSIESIGISENRLSSLYEYFDNRKLKSYKLNFEEGKGIARKQTRYEFAYDSEDRIVKYFFEESGQGQDFKRVNCGFEHITNDDGTINTTFALNDDGETLRTAIYEYENRNNYSVKIFDDQNQLIVTYRVEQK